jgi:hypothetical protein
MLTVVAVLETYVDGFVGIVGTTVTEVFAQIVWLYANVVFMLEKTEQP